MPITYLRCCYCCVYNQLKASYSGRVKYNRSFQGQLYANCNEKLNRDSIFYYPVTKEFQIQIIYDRKGTKTSENELN